MSTLFARPQPASTVLPEFVIAYQPIVNVVAHRVVAYEALTRGADGRSYPELVAGMDISTTRRFHRRSSAEAIRLAVELGIRDRNASLCLNLQPDLHPEALDADYLLGVARSCGIAQNEILLELTEDHRMSIEELHELMARNQAAGFCTGVDDFGAGYAGLTMLVECKPEVVKLDRALITGIDTSDRRQKIIAAFTRISESLKMNLVAEGVETLEEYAMLRELGIQFMQGFLFSRAVVDDLPSRSVWGVVPDEDRSYQARSGSIHRWLDGGDSFGCAPVEAQKATLPA